jgi:2-dehydro-3-deoxygluconokinase
VGRILLIGECMVEFSPKADGDYKRGFAGDTFNTAWYLRQLLPSDWAIQYFTNIGDDQMSLDMLNFMSSSGIDTTHVKVMAGMNVGLYVISLDKGERSFSYWRSTSAARSLADDPARLAGATEGADCVLFSGITLAILADEARDAFLLQMATLRRNGVLVVFDPNIRRRLWQNNEEIRHWIARAYAVANLALPSFADDAEIFGDTDVTATAQRISMSGVSEIVVKNGGGVCFVQALEEICSVEPHSLINVVDTTGAGDSFNAGYLASRLIAALPSAAVQNAHGIAAKVICAHGALVPLGNFWISVGSLNTAPTMIQIPQDAGDNSQQQWKGKVQK